MGKICRCYRKVDPIILPSHPLSLLHTGKEIRITCFKASYFFKAWESLSQLVYLSLQLCAFSHHVESDLLCDVSFHFLDFWSSQSNLDLKELVGNSGPTPHLNAWMLNIECIWTKHTWETTVVLVKLRGIIDCCSWRESSCFWSIDILLWRVVSTDCNS